MREGFRVGLIKKIDYGIRNEKFEETVRNHPNLKVIVSWHGDLCTVTVPKPDCMKDIGNGMWMLPQPPDGSKWFYMDIKGPLFVRKCVRDICEKVVFPRLLQNTNDKRVCMISGTPGIGKSVLTNWVIAMIRSYFKDKDIYLFHFSHKLRYEIQRNGWCFEITKEYYNNAVMHNPDAIVLIDAGGPDAPGDFKHAGFAMVTASPAAIPKEMRKESNFSKAFLSVWEIEDILAAYRVLNRKDKFGSKEQADASWAELWRRIAFAGGVPRILFGKPGLVEDYEADVAPAISSATENIRPHISLRENVHKVFHIFAGKTLAKYQFGYATQKIGEKFEMLLKRLNSDKIKILLSGFIEENVRISALQSGVGVVYEATIHGMLASSFYVYQDEIKWRGLTPSNSMAIGKLEEDRTREMFSVGGIKRYRPNTYYVPHAQNQPVIASWVKEGNVLYFFQITKKTKRTFGDKESNFFQKIGENREDIQIRFIYVIPSLVVADFKFPGSEDQTKNLSMGVLGVDVMESGLDFRLKEQFKEWEEPMKKQTRDATTGGIATRSQTRLNLG